MRRFAVVLSTLAGCTFSTNGVSGDDVAAIDASVADATPVDADPTMPDATCTPGCDGTTLDECNGGNTIETDCELGCSIAGTPHCEQMVPSNLTDLSDLTSVNGALNLPGGDKYTLFTDTGEIVDGGGTVIRMGVALDAGIAYRQIDANLAVLSVDSMNVGEGALVFGFGTRALIILSRGAVIMDGYFDFSAGCDLGGAGYTVRCGGPGAGDGGAAGGPGTGCAGGGAGTNSNPETGGGGGGFASMGGNAGTGNGSGLASSIASCASASLVPLQGGGGGGAGSPNGASEGGGGGGALQISSLDSITVGSVGVVSRPEFFMPGGYGSGNTTANKGGGGGGAGGAVLLEAPTVTISDVVVITGGGGGGGGRPISQDGAYGTETGLPAAGGLGDGAGMLNGIGGTGGTPTATSGTGGGTVRGTGGGGGGYGRLRINNASGVFTLPVTALVVAASSVGPIARN